MSSTLRSVMIALHWTDAEVTDEDGGYVPTAVRDKEDVSLADFNDTMIWTREHCSQQALCI
eukprot:9268822-Alexandrium_andersonii.AAC.1